MNVDQVRALNRAFHSVKERREKRIPRDLEDKKERLRSVRAASVGNEELLNAAIDRLRGNGIEVRLAGGAGEAVRYIMEEIAGERLVVKSKSNVTKEIDLAARLEDEGIKVVETDIGDRILQLLGASPSHPTGPIAHLSASAIAEGLSLIYGTEVGKSPEEVVACVKREIGGFIGRAEIGITGANAVTAEEGAFIVAHNEGNISEVIRNRKLIVVTAIDKVYPSVEDALNMLKVLSYHATGSILPSFVEVMSGPSKTADVEKKFIRGVYRPESIVLILVDNMRSELIKNGFRELLSCIDCGNCLISCPMYQTVGNHFAEGKYLGGKGLAYESLSSGEINRKLGYCLSCGRCRDNCPLGIDVPAIIKNIRSESLPEEIYYFLKSHILYLYFFLRLRLG